MKSILIEVLFIQLSDEWDQASLTFGTEADVLWRRPVSLSELLSLKKQYPAAVLVAGNTTIGMSMYQHLHCSFMLNLLVSNCF